MAAVVGRKSMDAKKEQLETKVYHAALPLSSAVRTGLEPATPCVTGMYSNQAELPHRLVVLFASGGVLFPFALQSYELFLVPANFFANFFALFCRIFFI